MATKQVHRIGFTQLSPEECVTDRYRVNIIFIHGLRGHPRHTWEAHRPVTREDADTLSSRKRNRFLATLRPKSSANTAPAKGNQKAVVDKVFWPDEFLVEDLPDARIWTWGYDADAFSGFFKASNRNTVSQHSQDLQVQIERDIYNKEPIIFVAHSLGGIVVKDALFRSSYCRKRTKFIVFLGTPHRGSSFAGWGFMAASLGILARQDMNKDIVGALELKSEILNNIHNDFQTVVRENNLRIHSFQEGKGLTGMKLVPKVVDDFSSKLDLKPWETVETIDADHRDMARSANREDEPYRKISGVLRHFIRDEFEDNSHEPSTKRETSDHEAHDDAIEPAAGLSTQPGAVPITAQPSISSTHNTPCYNIPLKLNKRFVGRDSMLQGLQRKLFTEKTTETVAVYGLGGIGKTQVALQFAYWVKDHYQQHSIFWVSALSRASFEQGYAEIFSKVQIPQKNNEEDIKDLVKQYLGSEAAGPWLLIVDNADSMDLLIGEPEKSSGILEFIPSSDSGMVLYTTRFRDIALQVADIDDTFELSDMGVQEARSVFRNFLADNKRHDDDAIVDELIKKLEYLPLAITQAAAYLNRNPITVAQYLQLLDGPEQQAINVLTREFPDQTRYKGSRNAVATTWCVSFLRISASDQHAAKLLSFIACIEPKAIPRSILPSLDPDEQTFALGTLLGYSFLVARADGETFDMHSLVHLALCTWLKDQGDGSVQARQTLMCHMDDIFPTISHESQAVWRQLLPHTLRVVRQAEDPHMAEFYKLGTHIGLCYCYDDRLDEAILLLRQSCRGLEEILPPDHRDLVISQHALALAYSADYQLKPAIELLEHVVTLEETTLPEDDSDRLASQFELGNAYLRNGQAQEAVAVLERVVAVEEAALPEDDGSRLASEASLAEAYVHNGQVQKAIELLESVLRMPDAILSYDDIKRLEIQQKLGKAYIESGRIKEAIELLEDTVSREAALYPEDHSDRLASQYDLGSAYLQNGQVKKAIRLLEHVATQESTLREDHPERLSTQHELGRAYVSVGQFKEAIELLEHVVSQHAAIYPEDHIERLKSQHELARAYMRNGQRKEAIKLFEHVVAVEKTSLEEDDSDRLLSQELLGAVYQADGRVDEAVEIFEYTAAVRKAAWGEDNPDTLELLAGARAEQERLQSS